MSLHTLKADPDISLNITQQVPQVNWTVCVGQCIGDQYSSFTQNQPAMCFRYKKLFVGEGRDSSSFTTTS